MRNRVPRFRVVAVARAPARVTRLGAGRVSCSATLLPPLLALLLNPRPGRRRLGRLRDHSEHARDLAVAITQGRHREMDVDARAVLALAPGIDAAQLFACEQAIAQLLELGAFFRWHDDR